MERTKIFLTPNFIGEKCNVGVEDVISTGGHIADSAKCCNFYYL